MKNRQILVTGHRGFLCSHLMEALSGNWFTEFSGNVCERKMYTNVDIVIHFASPSQDIEFVDKMGTASTIIDGTLNLLDIAVENKAKFIFASTMGIYDARPGLGTIYETCKLAMDSYIQSVYNDYVILRIPRVYGKTRTKGLMRNLREGTVPQKDMSNKIEFMTVDEFVDQTVTVLGRSGYVHEYNVPHKETIRQIKRRFV